MRVIEFNVETTCLVRYFCHLELKIKLFHLQSESEIIIISNVIQTYFSVSNKKPLVPIKRANRY